MLTPFILVLLYSYLGKPVSSLVGRIKDSELAESTKKMFTRIRTFATRCGRTATRPVLTMWYILTDSNTSKKDKAVIYGALLYVISPLDLVPRDLFRMLGILDDTAIAAFIYKKISSMVTPEIMLRTEDTLDGWFGHEAPSGSLPALPCRP